MDLKLEHTSIIDKKNQLLWFSRKGDIQFFCRFRDFWATLCCLASQTLKEFSTRSRKSMQVSKRSKPLYGSVSERTDIF